MQVEVGPVAATSMGAFARFGRGVLQSAGPGADVPSDAASAFLGYLDEWEALASATARRPGPPTSTRRWPSTSSTPSTGWPRR